LLGVVWNSANRDYQQIVKLDGLTGQARTIYSSPVGDVSLDAPVPHPDGTAFFHQLFCYHDGTWPNCGDWVVGALVLADYHLEVSNFFHTLGRGFI
jgi:hypothetical protein